MSSSTRLGLGRMCGRHIQKASAAVVRKSDRASDGRLPWSAARSGSMKRMAKYGAIAGLVLATALLALASSHREAPLISADPLADNTDVYAFVSPDHPETVTLIANWIP